MKQSLVLDLYGEASDVHSSQSVLLYYAQEAKLVDAWSHMEDVNAVIFHQLEDNLPCQGVDAKFAIGPLTKPDPSC